MRRRLNKGIMSTGCRRVHPGRGDADDTDSRDEMEKAYIWLLAGMFLLAMLTAVLLPLLLRKSN